jgi:hypothetical protein
VSWPADVPPNSRVLSKGIENGAGAVQEAMLHREHEYRYSLPSLTKAKMPQEFR